MLVFDSLESAKDIGSSHEIAIGDEQVSVTDHDAKLVTDPLLPLRCQ